MTYYRNRFAINTLLTILAWGASTATLAECKSPTQPMVPNGMTADKDTIIAATVNVKAYIADNEDYRRCLKKELDALGETATDEQKADWAKKHDASVDAEEQTAASFNAQIRIFKSR